jgi:hypothetical protein
MKNKPDITCPHCGQPLTPKFIYESFGKLAGRTTGKAKARTHEQAQKAAAARWEKWRADKKD